MEPTRTRILITEGTGFLAMHVAECLEKDGADVFPVSSSLYDLRHEGDALAAFLAARPDIVVHIATGSALRDRAMAAANVIHAAAIQRARFIMISNPSAYGIPENGALKEEMVLRGVPLNEAGEADRFALALCGSYRRKHNLGWSFLIPAELYGPGADPRSGGIVQGLVNTMLDAAKENVTSTAFRRQCSPRSILYVGDAARAIALLCRSPIDGVFNLAGSEPTSEEDLAKRVVPLCEYKGKVIWQSDAQEPARILDGQQAGKSLGWKPEVSLEDGLQLAVRWQKEASRLEAK